MGPQFGPAWKIGNRVSRPNGEDAGTIVKTGERIKVRWDSGRTSYFQCGKPANVVLEPLPDKAVE